MIDDTDDCEDQGFSRISDGCLLCGSRWRGIAPLKQIDGFWKCEKCGGSYGPVKPT